MNTPIQDWHGKHVWIIGASSGIGAETAKLLLSSGAIVALSARNAAGLQACAAGYPESLILPLDITDHAALMSAQKQLLTQWGQLDLVLIVAGTYHKMRADSFDLAVAQHLLDINLGGPLKCLDVVLPVLLAQKNGGIGIVASVAGLNGLPEALIYGPSKAALINLAEALYLDLHPRGINVYLINPGFVATPLTAGNEFAMPALIAADTAAQAMVRGIERGEFHIHFPKRFTNWLRLLRLLPYRWYFWLVHKVTGL